MTDEMVQWADEWSLVLTHERSVTESTCVTYMRGVRQFIQFVATEHPGVMQPAQLTERHVGHFIRSLLDAGKSVNTARIRLKTLRLWLGYLATQSDSGLTTNPAGAVDLPPEHLPPVPVVSDEDLAALLRSMSGTSFVDRRDTVATRLLLDCGMRRGELVGIDVANVDLRHQEVTLTKTKGGVTRIVPFGGRTAIAIQRYNRARAQHPGASDPAFLLSTRATGSSYRVTGGAIAEMLGRRCAAAGISEIHPHQLRHTWANDMLSAGANEVDVERLAGWSTPMMVRRYGRSVADQRARESARRLGRGDRV